MLKLWLAILSLSSLLILQCGAGLCGTGKCVSSTGLCVTGTTVGRCGSSATANVSCADCTVTIQHATAACVSGTCQYTQTCTPNCRTGYKDCDGNPANGCETSLTLNTTSLWDGVQYIHAFDNPSSATYGQVFTPPPCSTKLTAFTFYLDQPVSLKFYWEIYAWEFGPSGSNTGTHAGRAIGPRLYRGPLTHTAVSGPAFTPITFHPNVALTPGQYYVALATMIGVAGDPTFPTSQGGRWGAIPRIPGMPFVWSNLYGAEAQLTTQTWDDFFSITGAFSATFT